MEEVKAAGPDLAQAKTLVDPPGRTREGSPKGKAAASSTWCRDWWTSLLSPGEEPRNSLRGFFQGKNHIYKVSAISDFAGNCLATRTTQGSMMGFFL
jgi:hypothetical protein